MCQRLEELTLCVQETVSTLCAEADNTMCVEAVLCAYDFCWLFTPGRSKTTGGLV